MSLIGTRIRNHQRVINFLFKRVQEVQLLLSQHLNGTAITKEQFRIFKTSFDKSIDNISEYYASKDLSPGKASITMSAIFYPDQDILWWKNRFKGDLEEWKGEDDEIEYRLSITKLARDPDSLIAIREHTGYKNILNYSYIIIWK